MSYDEKQRAFERAEDRHAAARDAALTRGGRGARRALRRAVGAWKAALAEVEAAYRECVAEGVRQRMEMDIVMQAEQLAEIRRWRRECESRRRHGGAR